MNMNGDFRPLACCLTHRQLVEWKPFPSWWRHRDLTSCYPMLGVSSPTGTGLYWLRRNDVHAGSLGAQRERLAIALRMVRR